MKQLQEMQERDMHEKEVDAVRQTGFSQGEVADFRELFLAADSEGYSELSLSDISSMLGTILPLGDKHMLELKAIFEEICAMQGGCEGSRDLADFPEFLIFMKRLLDENFARIKEISRRRSTNPRSASRAPTRDPMELA